jgi:phage gp36-like protein
MNSFKQPSERFLMRFDFALTGGLVTISEVSSVTISARRGVAGAALGVADQAHDGAEVRLLLAGGVDGESYAVRVVVTTADGETLEQDGEIDVIDLQWTVPDGASSYASIADYVERFGIEETIRLTDERRAGVVDRKRLMAALVNASAICDLHLARRYGVPVAPVPPILTGWACDLARRRLHSVSASEEVVAAFDAAIAMLRDVAKGVTAIPNAAETGGLVATGGSSDAPLVSADDRLFTAETLKGY